MSQSVLPGRLAVGRAVDVQPVPSPRYRPRNGDLHELELKLAALQKEHAHLQLALFEAGQVYRRLCAPRLVRHGDFEIASEIFAVRYLPGDFFVVQESGSGVVIALGDICGKGLAAGMWTTHLVGLVNRHIALSADPAEIVAGINRDMCRTSSPAPLTSLFLARLDSGTGTLDYCSAGHPPTMLLRGDGQLESLSEGGPVLGVVPAAEFAVGSTQLRVGDLMLVYSDGVIEACDQAEQEFGLERLEAQLRGSRNGSARSALFSVLGAVQDFVAECPQTDDMSLAVVRRR